MFLSTSFSILSVLLQTALLVQGASRLKTGDVTNHEQQSQMEASNEVYSQQDYPQMFDELSGQYANSYELPDPHTEAEVEHMTGETSQEDPSMPGTGGRRGRRMPAVGRYSRARAELMRKQRQDGIPFDENDPESWPKSRLDVQPIHFGSVTTLPGAVIENLSKITAYAQSHSGNREDVLFHKNFYYALLAGDVKAQNTVLAYFKHLKGDRRGADRLLDM